MFIDWSALAVTEGAHGGRILKPQRYCCGTNIVQRAKKKNSLNEYTRTKKYPYTTTKKSARTVNVHRASAWSEHALNTPFASVYRTVSFDAAQSISAVCLWQVKNSIW